MFPLRCATAQYHLTIWAVKSHFRELAKFKILSKESLTFFGRSRTLLSMQHFSARFGNKLVWCICRVMIAVTGNYWSSHFCVASCNAAECNRTFSLRVHRRTCLSVWCALLVQSTVLSRVASVNRCFLFFLSKVMCVANVIFGQERLTEQFLSMNFFYDSVILFTKQCSSPSEHFAFNALFL